MVKPKKKVVIVGEGLGMLNGLVAGVSHDADDAGLRDHVVSSFLTSHHRTRNNPPPPTTTNMSVSLNPSKSLGFHRPLTILVKRSLTITNNNPQPVAFKVKTTAPKGLREEPPLNTQCKDKFLIQSTIITPERELLPLHDLWANPDTNEEGKIFQQKLRVTYLPPEGQTVEEEDENINAGLTSNITANESQHYDTVRQTLGNGNLSTLDSHYLPATQSQEHPDERAHTPNQEPLEREVSTDTEVLQQQQVPVIVEPGEHPSSPAHVKAALPDTQESREPSRSADAEPVRETTIPSSSEPAHEPTPAPAHEPIRLPAPAPIIIHKENPVNEELYAKYNRAQEEIERLKSQIAELTTPAAQELRRRTRKLSDADSVAASDVQTVVVEDAPLHQEGVPLQVVVIIALGFGQTLREIITRNGL
ncbi:Vesicle-associated membrane protein-associated protein scs22, partial [Psilocybe cubensis]